MAYVNVKDWSVEQVTEWLKGIDGAILQYAKSFLNNGVNGHQLLNLRVDDLEHLGVQMLGHQELILEAVEHIRTFHYELDKENLQTLAMHLSCASNSLNRELHAQDENVKMVQSQTLCDVHTVLARIKPLVCWLDRSPFEGDKVYNELKSNLLQMGFEMATTAHRDIFTVKPIKSIRDICDKITKLADKIIQELTDPMILQPATLDLCTFKKKDQDCGFSILPSNNGVHQITEISLSHINTKIEDGDEIVQVNYQTVVGWNPKEVMHLLETSPTEIVLTLKKRPRHTKIYGQIYMKPYRLPSRKRSAPVSRWTENLPSPRLLAIPDLPHTIAKFAPTSTIQEVDNDPSSSGESDCEPPDSPLENPGRLYPLKPRSVLQRRNTITGATPISTRLGALGLEEVKHLMRCKNQATSSSYTLPGTDQFEDDSLYIRDKSASCSHGLERDPRPTTVIGLHNTKNSFKSNLRKKIVNFDETRTVIVEPHSINVAISATSLSSLRDESIEFIDECEDLQDRSKMTHQIVTVGSNDSNGTTPPSVKSIKESITEANRTKCVSSGVRDTALEDVRIDNIIKKFEKPVVAPRGGNKPLAPVPPAKPVVMPRNVKSRGKLDKSHSTPAYDLQEEPSEEPLVLKHQPEVILKVPEKIPEQINNREKCDQEIFERQLEKVSEKLPETKIKYELGIPLVRYPPITAPPAVEPRKKMDKSPVPPKPPVRTNIPEQYRKKSESHNDSRIDVNLNTSTNQKDKTDFDTVSISNNKIIINEVVVVNKPLEFEPMQVSTPVAKTFAKDETNKMGSIGSNINISTNTSREVFKIDTHKGSNKEKEHKTSPSTSLVRAICSSKSKSKKKNSLLLKRRKVSVNDVSPGEMQGFLHQRLKSKHDSNIHWEKRWFVLNQNCLYGFASKESGKAECYIVLSGFTVTEATEVKSRMHAFKVYHTGTVFYFSAESKENLNFWLETIALATSSNTDLSKSEEIQYSETDNESDNDSNTLSSTKSEKSDSGIIKFNSLKKFASRKRDVSVSSGSSGSTSLDRKRFFNKSNNQRNVVPVPTAQFRSYRKIPTSTTIGNFTSHIPNFAVNKNEAVTGTKASNVSVDSIPNTIQQEVRVERSKPDRERKFHMHASNPTLCNVDQFPFYGFPHQKPRHDHNMLGFLTLEELMMRESDGKIPDLPPINPNLIHPDVVYGEVPVRTRAHHKTHMRTASDCTEPKKESSCFGKRSSSIKSRHKEYKPNNSLPRSIQQKLTEPTYLTSKQKSSSSKSLKTSDSYEMIYRPQVTTTDIHYAQNRSLYNDLGHISTPQKSMSLKSATQYTPMALPLSPDDKKYSSHGFELNLDDGHKPSGGHKSKFKFFQKKSPKSSSKVALSFDSTSSNSSNTWNSPEQFKSSSSTDSFAVYSPEYTERTMSSSQSQVITIQDYPGLEYPPVFEAETYSLSNPQGTLLRKQSKK